MSINADTKEERGVGSPWQPSNCLGRPMGGVAPPPKGKRGGLLGNGPPSLETGELYNFTRLYCFLTTNDF